MLPASMIYASTPISTEWFHLVLNYLGSGYDQGVVIYQDGTEKVIGQIFLTRSIHQDPVL